MIADSSIADLGPAECGLKEHKKQRLTVFVSVRRLLHFE